MFLGVERGVERRYQCDRCGGAVAGIAVWRRLLAEGMASQIWSSAPPDAAEARAATCAFCLSPMRALTAPAGQAALCRTCQVMWLDRDAHEATARPQTEPLRRQLGLLRCDNCGAAIASPLDDRCRYCSATLVKPMSPPVPAPTRRGSDVDWGGIGYVLYGLGRLATGVLDWFD